MYAVFVGGNRLDETTGARTIADRRSRAIDRCQEQIRWYEAHATKASTLYRVFQTAAVVLGGLTPILILWTDVPKPIQALPGAGAAIAAALVGLHHWQEDWTRFAGTAEALKSELLFYETRTSLSYRPSIGDEAALDNFVQRIEALAERETGAWSALQIKQFTERGSQQSPASDG